MKNLTDIIKSLLFRRHSHDAGKRADRPDDLYYTHHDVGNTGNSTGPHLKFGPRT